jgi:hypothetical protein
VAKLTCEELFNLKPEPTRLDFMEYADMELKSCEVAMGLYRMWKLGLCTVHGDAAQITEAGIKEFEKRSIE